MPVDKLSSEKERTVVGAIERIIDTARGRPIDELHKVAVEVFRGENLEPELIKRACEAFNKSKSVYMLTKLSSQNRAEPFPLLDSKAIMDELYVQKQADEPVRLPAAPEPQSMAVVGGALSKVASEVSPEGNIPSLYSLRKECWRASEELSLVIRRLQRECQEHKEACDTEMQTLFGLTARMGQRKLRKLAHIVVNRYGDDGARLLRIVSAKLGKDLPLEKTAAAAVLPYEEPYTNVDRLMREARLHRQQSDLLNHLSKEAQPKGPKSPKDDKGSKGDGPIGKAFGAVAGGATEGGVNTAKRLLDPIMAFAETPIYMKMTKGGPHSELGEEVLDADLQNELSQIRTMRSFADVASDEFIRDYSIDEITTAYNNVVTSLPELQREENQPWLKTLVRQQLVHGGSFDPATIEQYATMRSNLGRSALARTQMDIDEAGRGRPPVSKPSGDDGATSLISKAMMV